MINIENITADKRVQLKRYVQKYASFNYDGKDEKKHALFNFYFVIDPSSLTDHYDMESQVIKIVDTLRSSYPYAYYTCGTNRITDYTSESLYYRNCLNQGIIPPKKTYVYILAVITDKNATSLFSRFPSFAKNGNRKTKENFYYRSHLFGHT